MCLKSGLLAFSNGRVRNSSVTAPTQFNAGTPTNDAGVLCWTNAPANASVHEGLVYSGNMALYAKTGANPLVFGPGGVPMRSTVDPAVCLETSGAGVIVGYMPGGIPLDANGNIVCAVPE